MLPALVKTVSTWWRYRVAVRQLAAMDERALRDIGLNRMQIKRVVWTGTRG